MDGAIINRYVREADVAPGTTGRGGPGRSERISLPVHAMARMFSTEAKARKWLESVMWPDGPCGGMGSSAKRQAGDSRSPGAGEGDLVLHG